MLGKCFLMPWICAAGAIRNVLGSVQKVLVATVKGIARAALTPPANACTASCGTYLSRDPLLWAAENQDANSRAPVPQL